MDRFAQLETFVAVVEAGSLSAAAKRLGVAVSAVSRRMDDLETRLGVRLANRSTRGFAPTPLGLRYYQDATRLLADAAGADAQARGEAAAMSGVLRVAAPVSFGVRHLAPVLADLAVEAPDLRLELTLDDRRSDLVAEGVDLAIRIGRLEDSGLIARKLFDIRHVLAASPEHWSRFGLPRTPQDLAEQPALVYRRPLTGAVWRYRDPQGRDGEVRVAPRVAADNGDMLVRLAERGLGVLSEPSFVLSDALHRGTLIPALEDHRWFGAAAYIVYPPGRPLPARARRLIDGLTTRLSTDPDAE